MMKTSLIDEDEYKDKDADKDEEYDDNTLGD